MSNNNNQTIRDIGEIAKERVGIDGWEASKEMPLTLVIEEGAV